MRRWRQISLRFLLANMIIVCFSLGFLVRRDSQIEKRWRELESKGISCEADFEPGVVPFWLASQFPAAFCKPRIAWIYFRVEGDQVTVAGKTYPTKNSKPHFEEIIAHAQNAGFEVRFAEISPINRWGRRPIDVVKMFPEIGDGKYWVMPESMYEESVEQRRAALFDTAIRSQ